MTHFVNAFHYKKQGFLLPADQLSLQLGGSGVANCSGWHSCRCPAHSDDRASLSLKSSPHGLIARCFAGCRSSDIRKALSELTMSGRPIKATPPTPAVSPAKLQEIVQGIWQGTLPSEGTPTVQRMCDRGLTRALPATLRHHPWLFHKESGTSGPAMVALVQDKFGEMAAIHRTWLNANLKPQRKSLAPVAGHSVWLNYNGIHKEAVAGEGIESVIAAAELYAPADMALFAALSWSGLQAFRVPDSVEIVHIAADHDEVGLNAARALQRRLQAEGRTVDIWCPPQADTDFNDVLQGARG